MTPCGIEKSCVLTGSGITRGSLISSVGRVLSKVIVRKSLLWSCRVTGMDHAKVFLAEHNASSELGSSHWTGMYSKGPRDLNDSCDRLRHWIPVHRGGMRWDIQADLAQPR